MTIIDIPWFAWDQSFQSPAFQARDLKIRIHRCKNIEMTICDIYFMVWMQYSTGNISDGGIVLFFLPEFLSLSRARPSPLVTPRDFSSWNWYICHKCLMLKLPSLYICTPQGLMFYLLHPSKSNHDNILLK